MKKKREKQETGAPLASTFDRSKKSIAAEKNRVAEIASTVRIDPAAPCIHCGTVDNHVVIRVYRYGTASIRCEKCGKPFIHAKAKE